MAPDKLSAFFSNARQPYSSKHSPEFEEAIKSLCGDSISRAPLATVLYNSKLGGLAYVSGELEKMIGRPLEADDFCRTSENGYNVFSYSTIDADNFHLVMNFLKQRKSYFSAEALLIKNNNKETFLESIVSKGLVDQFLDFDYWQHAPDVLRDIRCVAPKVMEEKIDRLLNTIDAQPPLDPSLPKPVDTAKLIRDITASVAKLQEIGDKIAVPTVDQLLVDLRKANGDMQKIWSFGDETLKLRRDFLFAAMSLTTATSMQDGVSGLITDFLGKFSKARDMLDTYAKQSKGEKGQSQGWSFFGKKSVKELVKLSDAIAMAHGAGKSLTASLPGIDAAEKCAIEKMKGSNYILSVYDRLDQSLEAHQEAARIFLQGGSPAGGKDRAETAQRPHENVARVLEHKTQMIADIRGAIAADRGAEELVAGVFARQAYVYARQNVMTMPALASQVTGLHRTLDFLQSSASSRGLADASRLAASEQAQHLVLSARKTIEAITATVESVRDGVKAIDQEVVAALTESKMLHEPARPLAVEATAGSSPKIGSARG